MGIPKQVIKLLKHENDYKTISGQALVCGRQTVLADREMIRAIFHDQPEVVEKMLEQWENPTNVDSGTRASNGSLRDDVFFKAFLDIHYDCVDVSDYEGANIVLDLNQPVPDSMRSQFDLIYTGGCHDNIFNPISMLINTTKMLAPGGRVIHYETCGGLMGAYLMFSPEWFYSYYAVNNFKDCKVYACHQTEAGASRFDYETHVFLYNPYYTRDPNIDYFKSALASAGIMYVMVVAEKGEASTENEIPIQLQYLDKNTTDWRLAESGFADSPRPLLKGDRQGSYTRPFLSDHFHYLGSGF